MEVLKMIENHKKPCFTFFAFSPPYIGVSGSLVSRKRKSGKRSIDWYQKILISCLAATFYVFCVFTPLYRRFSLSHALQSVDLEDIYRLVSKILNFMACGSVFGRFCVLYGLLLFAGAAGNDRQVPTYMVRRNSYYSSAAVARTVAENLRIAWKINENQ